MINVSASAPGKVFVAGEYAVLDGAPALCMAVNRRAQVSVTSSTENFHVVAAPGFSKDIGRFKSIADSANEYPLLAAVWTELQIETPDFLNIVLDSSGFVDIEGGKLGIGSSAALTVALTAALIRLAGERQNIRAAALAAHRHLQNGAGSGGDIACSLAGGMIEYRMHDNVSRVAAWPAGLYYGLLWSGVSADTRSQLDKLAHSDAQGTRAELGDAAEALAEVWGCGDAAKIMAALHHYGATLRRFDVDHKLGIFDAGHAALADNAESSGVVYKPCGAGGGDLGIAVSSDESALAAFVNAAQKQNFRRMDLTIDAVGVVVDGNE